MIFNNKKNKIQEGFEITQERIDVIKKAATATKKVVVKTIFIKKVKVA
jgi:hypothetical protein